MIRHTSLGWHAAHQTHRGIAGRSDGNAGRVIFVNGEAAAYDKPEVLLEQIEPRGQIKAVRLTETVGQHQRRIQLLAGGAARNSFGPVTVSGDGFLALGDNRDNSADSRYFGFVSRHLLIGQANHLLVSADIKGNWLPRARSGSGNACSKPFLHRWRALSFNAPSNTLVALRTSPYCFRQQR